MLAYSLICPGLGRSPSPFVVLAHPEVDLLVI